MVRCAGVSTQLPLLDGVSSHLQRPVSHHHGTTPRGRGTFSAGYRAVPIRTSRLSTELLRMYSQYGYSTSSGIRCTPPSPAAAPIPAVRTQRSELIRYGVVTGLFASDPALTSLPPNHPSTSSLQFLLWTTSHNSSSPTIVEYAVSPQHSSPDPTSRLPIRSS